MTYEEHKAAVEAAAKAFYGVIENAKLSGMEVSYDINFFCIQKLKGIPLKERWSLIVEYKGNDKYNAEVQSYTMYRLIGKAGDALIAAMLDAAKSKFIFRVSSKGVFDACPVIE